MTDEKHNGWTNRETWLLNVHGFLDDPAMREDIRDELQDVDHLDMEAGRQLSDIAYGKARAMEENFDTWCIDAMEELRHAGYSEAATLLLQDILGQYGARVDWADLAGHMVQDEWQELRHERKPVTA
jgi:hypothetical protein